MTLQVLIGEEANIITSKASNGGDDAALLHGWNIG
jgi:hypothetical protein